MLPARPAVCNVPRGSQETGLRRRDAAASPADGLVLWHRITGRISIAGRKDSGCMTAAKCIFYNQCCAVIVDVQPFFLSQANKRLRGRLKTNFANFARLLAYYQVPVVVTLERPVDRKGELPKEIRRCLPAGALIFEKDSFDLCKDATVRRRLARLKKKQVLIAGCETDVCVLQSCLGLLNLGYEVFVVEELLFSSSRNVEAAVTRMKAEGAVFLSYKTLYYEMLETVDGPLDARRGPVALGPFPDDLPDAAV
jgi:isochorismate hydrolase